MPVAAAVIVIVTLIVMTTGRAPAVLALTCAPGFGIIFLGRGGYK